MEEQNDATINQADLSQPAEPSSVPAKHGIALCLSGGGYRAALFHLGVLRCLHDIGLLQKVETVSSVSGGSIMSAYLARRLFEENITRGICFNNWEEHVSSGFREFVRNDIRTIPFVTHILWNWLIPKWRARHLQRNYAKYLLTIEKDGSRRSLTLGDLPEKPVFIYCSTDVSFGINWEFRRTRVGDYHVGYADKSKWLLALAVAASSCFPPIFGPLKIGIDPNDFKGGSYRKDDRDELVARLKLSDGGVYDNLGIEPVDRDYETTIISDGGSAFSYMGTSSPISRLMRYMTVMMNQVASLRKRIFFTGITERKYTGAYINIAHERTSAPGTNFDGYVSSELRKMIAGVRTDLDRFTVAEASILENHGYYETLRRIKEKQPQLMADPLFEGITPHEDWTNEDKVRIALGSSSRRLVLSRLLGFAR